MDIVRRIFRREDVDMTFKVISDRSIAIFVNAQGCRGVLKEKMGAAKTIAGKLGQLSQDFIGYKMETARPGCKGNCLLKPAHSWRAIS